MCTEGDDDVLFREIQASIAEGKMMLPVLRSLPPSENNTALITLFEELISRLQNYQPKGNLSSNDVEKQLNLLKEKQERIRSLLTNTARDLQASGSSQFPGSSQIVSDELTDTAAELVSKFEAWFSKNTQSSVALDNANPKQEPEETNQYFNSDSEHLLVGNGSTQEQATNLNPSAQFSAQITKLNSLIEDAQKFEGMAERLLDITKRAHLREPSEFLEEILTRFGELRKSFDSLRTNCETIMNDRQMTQKLRQLQLATFQEFCVKLDRNLESTKECFFTIYHLVKSTIEHGMAEGSLRETDSDEAGPVESPTNPQSTANHVDGSTEGKTVLPSSPAVDSGAATSVDEAALTAQKAYLAQLQGQTRVEQEEIRRLLQQRDALAERLRTLKEAAAAAHESVDEEDSTESQSPENLIEPDASDGQPNVQNRLESKQRELEELKSQLALLRRAEQNISTVMSAGSTATQIDPTQSLAALREFFDMMNAKRSENTCRPLVSDRKRYNASTVDADTVRFEQPETIPLNGGLKSSYGLESLVSETDVAKLIHRALAPTGSIAASQDRTTMATWGGSSPTAPSSGNSSSSHGGARSGDFNKLDNSTHSARSHSNKRGAKEDNLAPQSAERITMPQLGHSPSPTTPRPFAEPSTAVKTESYFGSLDDRIRRLETTVGQIVEICRYLNVENSRISASMAQFFWQYGRHGSNSTGISVPLATSQLPKQSTYPLGLPYLPSSWAVPADMRPIQPFGSQHKIDSIQEQLQVILAQLNQQQQSCFQLQSEFQRLMRQQLETNGNHRVTSNLWQRSTPIPSQPMSPALSQQTASSVWPFDAPQPASSSGWPMSGTCPQVQPNLSIPHVPPTGVQTTLSNASIHNFTPSSDHPLLNFLSPVPSAHETSNMQTSAGFINDLLNQLMNPAVSTNARTGFP